MTAADVVGDQPSSCLSIAEDRAFVNLWPYPEHGSMNTRLVEGGRTAASCMFAKK